jgi:hypothetical protein
MTKSANKSTEPQTDFLCYKYPLVNPPTCIVLVVMNPRRPLGSYNWIRISIDLRISRDFSDFVDFGKTVGVSGSPKCTQGGPKQTTPQELRNPSIDPHHRFVKASTPHTHGQRRACHPRAAIPCCSQLIILPHFTSLSHGCSNACQRRKRSGRRFERRKRRRTRGRRKAPHYDALF